VKMAPLAPVAAMVSVWDVGDGFVIAISLQELGPRLSNLVIW